MKLSIIIPAHNEEQYIGKCLQSIKQQKIKNIEIMVVCDSCTDKTTKIAKKYTNKVYNVNFMHVSKARNYGLKKATGNIFCFLDGDCVIEGNLLEKVIEKINQGYIGGTCKTRALEDSWKSRLFWLLGEPFKHIFLTASGFVFSTKRIKFRENLKIAEDTYFILDLKKQGRVVYITNASIKTSSRRMEQQGYVKTLFCQVRGFFWKRDHKYDIVR
ncbi:glycosyltransferase family 2 protein [Candidatus Woesearchaeota archaeon]|nr:glycosyltransferase family 2 protein [Candidatus Woesearchaeota archaeon]